MRERSKKQGHAYICAHWQPLSSDRNCYKGVPMSDTEAAGSSEPSGDQELPSQETTIEIVSVEEESAQEPESQPEPAAPPVKDEEKEAETVEREEVAEPLIAAETEDREEYPEIVEEPPEELVKIIGPIESAELEELNQDMTSSQIAVEPKEKDIPELEPVNQGIVEEAEKKEIEKSEEMVDTVHNFQVDVSPSTEKRTDYGADEDREKERVDSSPEPATVQYSRTEEDPVDKDLENEMVVHGEQSEQAIEDRKEEKVLSPEPVASLTPVEEPRKEEPRGEIKHVAESPVTGMKLPSARAAIPAPKPKTAVPPKTTPSSSVPKRPTTALPAVKTPAKITLMSRPPAPFKASPAPPRPKAVPPRSQSQHRTPASRNGSTTKIDSLPNTPKLVNRKYQNVQSRVGSITDHKPQGGNVEIFSEKKTYKAESKIGSLHNAEHKPGGGNVKIETAKLNFKDVAKPKIDAVSNHTPKQSDKKIPTQKLNWNAQSKIGSLDNATHKAGGGQVKILNQKLEWNAESKVGSKDNIGHRPGGGNVQIYDEKLEYIAQSKLGSGGDSEKSF